jgi:hypothetical protein
LIYACFLFFYQHEWCVVRICLNRGTEIRKRISHLANPLILRYYLWSGREDLNLRPLEKHSNTSLMAVREGARLVNGLVSVLQLRVKNNHVSGIARRSEYRLSWAGFPDSTSRERSREARL